MSNLGGFFETRKRADDKKFVTCVDDVPDWLKEAVRDAHQGDLPNDWIYQECAAVCDAIDDGAIRADHDDVSDDIFEYADSRVDIYTAELFQWAADMCLSTTFAEAEASAAELGTEFNADGGGTSKLLGAIQFQAIRSIAETIAQAYKVALEDAEPDSEPEPESAEA